MEQIGSGGATSRGTVRHRGWRIVQASRDARLDVVIALAMACECAQFEQPQARLLGWL
jgi:hypothetical protein